MGKGHGRRIAYSLVVGLICSAIWDAGVAVAATQTISGTIWFDLDADGLVDPDEQGVSGVLVDLVESGSLVATATASSKGAFVFSPAAGTYDVSVRAGLGSLAYVSESCRWSAGRSRVCRDTVSGFRELGRAVMADPWGETERLLLGTDRIAAELAAGRPGAAHGTAVFNAASLVIGAKGVGGVAAGSGRSAIGRFSSVFRGLGDDAGRTVGQLAKPTANLADDAIRLTDNLPTTAATNTATGVADEVPAFARSQYGRVPAAERAAALETTPTCPYCGTNPSSQVDHITALRQDWGAGGWADDFATRTARINDPGNLIGACASCNASKGARVLDEGPGQWWPSGWPSGTWWPFGGPG